MKLLLPTTIYVIILNELKWFENVPSTVNSLITDYIMEQTQEKHQQLVSDIPSVIQFQRDNQCTVGYFEYNGNNQLICLMVSDENEDGELIIVDQLP